MNPTDPYEADTQARGKNDVIAVPAEGHRNQAQECGDQRHDRGQCARVPPYQAITMVIATIVSTPIGDDLQGCAFFGIRDFCNALPVERASAFERIGCPQTVRFGVIDTAGVAFIEREAKQMKGVKTSRCWSRPTLPSSKPSVKTTFPQQRRVAQ